MTEEHPVLGGFVSHPLTTKRPELSTGTYGNVVGEGMGGHSGVEGLGRVHRSKC